MGANRVEVGREGLRRDLVQRRVSAGESARVLVARSDDVVIHQRIHDWPS
jgi:hypothetical protein